MIRFQAELPRTTLIELPFNKFEGKRESRNTVISPKNYPQKRSPERVAAALEIEGRADAEFEGVVIIG